MSVTIDTDAIKDWARASLRNTAAVCGIGQTAQEQGVASVLYDALTDKEKSHQSRQVKSLLADIRMVAASRGDYDACEGGRITPYECWVNGNPRDARIDFMGLGDLCALQGVGWKFGK